MHPLGGERLESPGQQVFIVSEFPTDRGYPVKPHLIRV